MKKLLLLAALIYSVVAPLTYHPDTKLTLYYATLNQGKVWDIYSYLANNKDSAPDFHYPPVNYWLLKAELPIAKLVGGKGLEEWLNAGSNVAFANEKVFVYNLAVKMPLLILTILGGWIIYKIMIKNGKSVDLAMKAAAIWLFNPITLYSVVIMGQNDILAIFPFLVGLLYFYDRPMLAFMLFGIAGSVKSYPLIWAMMLAFSYPKSGYIKKIMLLLIPIVIYTLPMVPYIKYDYFKQSVIYSGLSIRMFESAIDIGFDEKILVVPVLLVVMLLIGAKKKMNGSLEYLNLNLMTATLLILGFTHFHPQWFIWIMPFVSMYMADKKDWWWLTILLASLLGIIILFDDKYLYWGLISPLNIGLINLPFGSEMLQRVGVDGRLLNNLCHSAIAGIGIYWLSRCATNEK